MTSIKARISRRTLAALALLAALVASPTRAQFEGGTYRPMQEDFDRIRLDHALVISGLLAEYRSATGRYPFAEGSDSSPAVVIIGTPEQQRNNRDFIRIRIDQDLRAAAGVPAPAPSRASFHTTEEFEAELGHALGRRVSLPVDPQRVPVNKPSIYIYVLYRDVYDVSVFLHQAFSFSRPLGEFHNKVALANKSLPAFGIWTAADLMRQPDFIAFFRKPFNRGGYKLRTEVLPPA
jgi:hypothetical protein